MEDYVYKVQASGRINVIGEHVDYCGGKVMPAALGLKNTVYVKPNGTNKINIRFTTLPDSVSLDIDKLEDYKNLKYGNYQAGAALQWKNAGHKLIGVDMLQDCKVPFGSGLSSSAAIEVSTIVALAVAAGEPFDNVEVALLAQKAEREYVGMNCGIMDQYISACGKKDHAVLLDCKTLEREYIPLELGDYALVIINSKKPHNLVESKYNERRRETEEALNRLKTVLNVECLAEVSMDDFARFGGILSGKIYDRAKHVVEECDRVARATVAMKSGDMLSLGRILNESHESLKTLFEVTGAELDALAQAAQSHKDCIGSRMIGGGFGGCTISLVKKSGVENFKAYVLEKYFKATGYRAECYDTTVEDGVVVTKL